MKKLWIILLLPILLAAGLVFIACDENGDEDVLFLGVIDPEKEVPQPMMAETIKNQDKIGKHDGYDYELWRDSGTVSMTLQNGGNFDCEWSNIGNALFRKGRKFDSTKTHGQIGKIEIEYSATFNPGGNSYLCVYGWTKSPLVEYYIVESWGTYRPTGTKKGTATINGGTYDLYETTRTNQPSIEGTKTFKQYWSVRQSQRTSGTISVTDHFNAWHGAGMDMGGKLYETSLLVEGYQSSGNAKVTKHILTIGGSGSSSNTNTNNTTNNNNNNTSSGNTTTSSTTTASGATKIEAENMTKGGQYTGNVSSPFTGVKLYANDDKVSFSQNFANNSHTFKVRGASSNSEEAQVQLKIGGQSYGTFKFKGTSATEQSITANHNQGGKNGVTVELICVNDNGKWDVLVDWIEIGASSGTSSGGTSSGGTSGGTAQASSTKYTFSQLSYASNGGGISYSVNSSGALSVTYQGQYKEVKYNLPSNINLSSYSAIVINASSPNGQTAVKFYDASGKEVFVQYNIKSSNATDTTITLSSAQKGNTIKTIGIMSQDTSNYSATINSITFK
jgi:endo-1,4-beta-xylanase